MISIFVFATIFSVTPCWAGPQPKPKKILTITPKFARQKGPAFKGELDLRAQQGFFINFGTPREQEETYGIMARNFGLNTDEVPVYVKNLQALASSSYDQTGSGGNTAEGGLGGGSGTGSKNITDGTNVAGTTKLSEQLEKSFEKDKSGSQIKSGTVGREDAGGTDGFGSGKGSGGTGEGSNETEELEKKEEEKIIETPVKSSEEEKVQEKIPEKQEPLKPFEYTLEPLKNVNTITQEEKEKSDEILRSITLRLMQISWSNQQTTLKTQWIDESGKVVDVVSGYASIKAVPGQERMKEVKPTNGFDAYYLLIKEQLIAFVGLHDGYKKRQELRDLLGSEESDGTLKKFIDTRLKNSSLETLYAQLVDQRRELLEEWVKLFEACFFDNAWVKDARNQRIWETVLINTIVAKRDSGNYGLSSQIVSDNEVKVVLLSLLQQILLLVPQQQLSVEKSDDSLQEEQEKEDTKKLLTKFLGERQKQKESQKIANPSTKEQKKHDIIMLDRDYVLELYDQLNRLRVNSHFEKMFTIIGSQAIKLYDKDSSPLKNNLFPLLLWLFDNERIKGVATFREMVRAQLFFNKEDPDFKTIFANLVPWNIIFDFHNFESKKYKKKIDVVAYINNELKQQTTINGVRVFVQRLRPLVVEKSLVKVKALEDILSSLDINVDSVLDLFEDILRNENEQSKLDGLVSTKLKKLINEYTAMNQKKVAIIEYLKDMKKIYEKDKKPITKELYDKFEKDNKKFKYMTAFQVKPLFYDLYRMPATLYHQFVKIAGKKQLVADIISQDEFYNYTVAYGMLLRIIEESQSNLLMLRNSLNAMNSGVIKSQDLYADAISKNTDNKTIITKGIYKGKLQGLIDAILQRDPLKTRQEIDAFVASDAINPIADSKYKELINNFINNFSTQTMLYYSVMMKVLNEGSAECPESAPGCLITDLPLEGTGVTQKEKVRNAYIYKKIAGLLTSLSSLFNPNNQPLTAQGLKDLDIQAVESEIETALQKIKNVLDDKNFDSYWVDQKNRDVEREQVLQSMQNHFNNVIATIKQLKLSLQESGTSPSIQTQPTQEFDGIPLPPPSPSEESGSMPPPPPPPPPGF